jgi:hypothetical protein
MTKKLPKKILGSLAAQLGGVHNFASPPRGGFAFIEYKINQIILSGIICDALTH